VPGMCRVCTQGCTYGVYWEAYMGGYPTYQGTQGGIYRRYTPTTPLREAYMGGTPYHTLRKTYMGGLPLFSPLREAYMGGLPLFSPLREAYMGD